MDVAGGCLTLSRPGNPFFSLYEGTVETGVLQTLNLSPWDQHFLGSRDGVLSILGCSQGGGLTPEPSLGLSKMHCHSGVSSAAMMARQGAVGSRGPSVLVLSVSEYHDNSLCSLEVSSCSHFREIC